MVHQSSRERNTDIYSFMDPVGKKGEKTRHFKRPDTSHIHIRGAARPPRNVAFVIVAGAQQKIVNVEVVEAERPLVSVTVVCCVNVPVLVYV